MQDQGNLCQDPGNLCQDPGNLCQDQGNLCQVRSEFGKFAYRAICMRNVYTLI